MIHKLYSLVDTTEKAKELLYIRGVKRRKDNCILMHAGEVLDFTTYFNSMSLKKWKRYAGSHIDNCLHPAICLFF